MSDLATAASALLAYFANGGPDTPIRTTWPEMGAMECWEVPAADLAPLLESLEVALADHVSRSEAQATP